MKVAAFISLLACAAMAAPVERDLQGVSSKREESSSTVDAISMAEYGTGWTDVKKREEASTPSTVDAISMAEYGTGWTDVKKREDSKREEAASTVDAISMAEYGTGWTDVKKRQDD